MIQRATRLIIFETNEEGVRQVFDILEFAGRRRFTQMRKRLCDPDSVPLNPGLHLKWREDFARIDAGELSYQIEAVF